MVELPATLAISSFQPKFRIGDPDSPATAPASIPNSGFWCRPVKVFEYAPSFYCWWRIVNVRSTPTANPTVKPISNPMTSIISLERCITPLPHLFLPQQE